MPFIMLGIGITALAFGIVIIAYLLFFGAIVGFTIFAIKWLQTKLFGAKIPPANNQTKQQGRIIDSNDWKEL
jgi:hypothetical protein